MRRAFNIATKSSASAAKNLQLKHALFGETKIDNTQSKPNNADVISTSNRQESNYATEDDIRKNGELLAEIKPGSW